MKQTPTEGSGMSGGAAARRQAKQEGGLLLQRVPSAKDVLYTNDHRPNPKELDGD